MKNLFLILAVVLLLAVGSGVAQIAAGNMGYMGTEGGMLYGGIGVSVIDDQTFFSIQARPEVAFGKVGIGLNLNLLFNAETGEIRKEDWDTGYDYFRLLRYVRYGHKWDPVYARVGTLDVARLGHGFILNYYTNEASVDMRKIGLAFDLDLAPRYRPFLRLYGDAGCAAALHMAADSAGRWYDSAGQCARNTRAHLAVDATMGGPGYCE